MKILLSLVFTLLGSAFSSAQVLSSISTRWSDSFVEWELYAKPATEPAPAEEGDEQEEAEPPDEELYGELKLRWLNLRDDWTDWDYSLGGGNGTIRMKWKDDPSQWELRSYDGTIVTMRAAWSGDPTEWRVTDNTISLTLRTRWSGQHDEWLVQDNNRGTFYLYTLAEGDPRDWAIEDRLDDSVSQPMKMALIFLAVYTASPRM
ncbi:MAG: hypothetical protein ACKVU2_04510 [Saprospiraceae bacterium]